MSMVIDPHRFGGDTFIMSYRQDVMTWSSVDGSGGMTYTRVQASFLLSGGMSRQANSGDSDNGDYMEWFVNLSAGTYTLTVVYRQATTSPIVDYKLDGVTVATVDQYGTLTDNVVAAATGIVVAADGNYTLRALVNGKNASSTDYWMQTKTVTLTRTGA